MTPDIWIPTNNQDKKMPLLKVNSPEKSNLAEGQDKDLKLQIMNMLKDIKEVMNECLNEDHENAN